jgi:hypothetical protein
LEPNSIHCVVVNMPTSHDLQGNAHEAIPIVSGPRRERHGFELRAFGGVGTRATPADQHAPTFVIHATEPVNFKAGNCAGGGNIQVAPSAGSKQYGFVLHCVIDRIDERPVAQQHSNATYPLRFQSKDTFGPVKFLKVITEMDSVFFHRFVLLV